MITTQAPAPVGKLSFSVEWADGNSGAAGIPVSRRRLHMQPLQPGSGQLTNNAAGAANGTCGVPLSPPAVHLRLPAREALSSVIWRDSQNRTLLVQTSAELSLAAAAGSGWVTAAVALPPQYPPQQSSACAAPSPSPSPSPSCQQAQRRYSVLLLAPDGRHSRADLVYSPASISTGAPGTLHVRYKHYEASQLSFASETLALPFAWPAAGGAAGPGGVTLFDASAAAGQPLQLRQAGQAVFAGADLLASSTQCSQQYSLAMLLTISGSALRDAAQSPGGDGQVLASVDGGLPAVTLGPALLADGTTSGAAGAALWLRWGTASPRHLALPSSLAALAGDQAQIQTFHLVLVRSVGGRWKCSAAEHRGRDSLID